jgi:hypothetical protein
MSTRVHSKYLLTLRNRRIGIALFKLNYTFNDIMSYEYSLAVFSEDEEVSVWIYIVTGMKQENNNISMIVDIIFINHNSHS